MPFSDLLGPRGPSPSSPVVHVEGGQVCGCWQEKSYLIFFLYWGTHRWSSQTCKVTFVFSILAHLWWLEGCKVRRGAPSLAVHLPWLPYWASVLFAYGPSFEETFLCLSLSVFLTLPLFFSTLSPCKPSPRNSLICPFCL